MSPTPKRQKVLQLRAADVAHFRREGYLVIPGVLPPAHVEACKTALSDLMQERVPRTITNLYYEAGQQIDGLSAAEREFDLLITCDRNLRYQQNLAQRTIRLLILTIGRWPALKPLGSQIGMIVNHMPVRDYVEFP